jgi:hypothetical protein
MRLYQREVFFIITTDFLFLQELQALNDATHFMFARTGIIKARTNLWEQGIDLWERSFLGAALRTRRGWQVIEKQYFTFG